MRLASSRKIKVSSFPSSKLSYSLSSGEHKFETYQAKVTPYLIGNICYFPWTSGNNNMQVRTKMFYAKIRNISLYPIPLYAFKTRCLSSCGRSRNS